jgi:hypothetical protein
MMAHVHLSRLNVPVGGWGRWVECRPSVPVSVPVECFVIAVAALPALCMYMSTTRDYGHTHHGPDEQLSTC